MLRIRVIPCLLLRHQGLVKTVKFKDPKYVGDPINAVKIFNEKGVDELAFLDITATNDKREPNLKLLSEIASECFMPLAYGGGIRNMRIIEEIFSIGVEKVVINTHAIENPAFVSDAAKRYGNQSIVVAIDVKRNLFGKHVVCSHSGKKAHKIDPVSHAKMMEEMGAGEIIVNSVDRDGMMAGYDVAAVGAIARAVNVPVIASGGAGVLEHFRDVVRDGHASAVAAGSMFVFQGKHRAVLISYPAEDELEQIFGNQLIGGE